MRVLGTLLVIAGLAAVTLIGPASAVAKDCGDQYGNITKGHQAILVLVRRNVTSCTTVRTLGFAVIAKPLPLKLDGFTCRRLNIQAGGGAADCTASRGREVEFGYE